MPGANCGGGIPTTGFRLAGDEALGTELGRGGGRNDPAGFQAGWRGFGWDRRERKPLQQIRLAAEGKVDVTEDSLSGGLEGGGVGKVAIGAVQSKAGADVAGLLDLQGQDGAGAVNQAGWDEETRAGTLEEVRGDLEKGIAAGQHGGDQVLVRNIRQKTNMRVRPGTLRAGQEVIGLVLAAVFAGESGGIGPDILVFLVEVKADCVVRVEDLGQNAELARMGGGAGGAEQDVGEGLEGVGQASSWAEGGQVAEAVLGVGVAPARAGAGCYPSFHEVLTIATADHARASARQAATTPVAAWDEAGFEGDHAVGAVDESAQTICE